MKENHDAGGQTRPRIVNVPPQVCKPPHASAAIGDCAHHR